MKVKIDRVVLPNFLPFTISITFETRVEAENFLDAVEDIEYLDDIANAVSNELDNQEK